MRIYNFISLLGIFILMFVAWIGKGCKRLGFRALFAATLACLMTAAVSGVFYIGGVTFLQP